MDKTIQSGIKNGVYLQWRMFIYNISQCCVIDFPNLYEPCFFSFEKSLLVLREIGFCLFIFAQEVTPGSFAPLLCVFRRHQSRFRHHFSGSGEHRRGHNQSHQVALITGPRTAAVLSPSPPEMSAGALCLWLVLAVRPGCVTPLAIPQDRRPEGAHGRPERITNAASIKQKTQFHLRDLPRGPAVAPHKKPPQFMLDLFNVVSVSHRTLKSQKEILDGSIVRSFEDKGKKKHFTDFRDILLLVRTHLICTNFQLRMQIGHRDPSTC